MKLYCCLLLIFVAVAGNGQPAFSKKTGDSSRVATLQKILDFINISMHDTVADIGTGAGYNLVPIANAYPAMHFTAEDIDSNYCNRTKLFQQIRITGYQTRIENFDIHYGTETSTLLPPAAYSKVLAFDVLHEMSAKPSMLADIRRILQPGGAMYIEEILVHKKAKKERACNYPYLTEQELKKILEDNHYVVNKQQLVFDSGHNKYIKIFECMPMLQ
jgi:cyclopropane fatty-acyl-phospholipid synthase-like methyltransferase